MTAVRRLYVEKKNGFDVEAQGLLTDLKENLHLDALTQVRVLNRYDIEGIDEETYQSAKYSVFAEPAIDLAYDEFPENLKGWFFFAVEYLPGQYDQRADSAVQCIALMNGSAAKVRFARVIALSGKLKKQEMESVIESVKAYCINPVDSREADTEKPSTLEMDMPVPQAVERITGFISKTPEELETFRSQMGFAMTDKDLLHVHKYYAEEEQRDPTVTELRVIDTYWSDHCRHTTFMTKITDVDFGAGKYEPLLRQAYEEYCALREDVYGSRTSEKDQCLMDMATIGTKYLKKKGLVPDLDESEEVNACSIKVKANIDGNDEDWLVMFKNETHNHPTEIEPFGGAATCLGGAIRDPLSGRVYVYQAMRVTGCADPTGSIDETLEGKLPQRTITREAANGYSSYGNQIGLATGQVSEIYHPGYVAKRMEIGAVIGAAPADCVVRQRPEKGDFIILVGGRTGRDGCGGATGSSKEHTEDSLATCGAEVQKGNPPVERNIQRLFRRKEAARLIKRCNDFGAGGVSVAIGELADSLDINLDLIPKKYEGLDGTELAISESQERMAVVIPSEYHQDFVQYAAEENLEAAAVARVTDSGRVRMFWKADCILDLSREFLNTNGATAETSIFSTGEFTLPEPVVSDDPAQLLADLNCCSQKGLVEQFDSTIGAGTVLMPLGGKYQLTPAMGMASKLPVTEGDTDTVTLMAYGFDPVLSSASPYHGAMYAVLDSVTKIAAMGGDISTVRLTFQEYFERLGDSPERWGKPFSALLGALKAQLSLEIPSIGGKDSMSGTFKDLNVPPTLVSFAVAVTDGDSVLSPELKNSDSKLVYVPLKRDEDGIPDFNSFRENMRKIRVLAKTGSLLSASTVSQGGLYVTLTKMALGNNIGVVLVDPPKEALLNPDYGSLVLELSDSQSPEALLKDIDFTLIGYTTERKEIRVTYSVPGSPEHIISLTEAYEKWMAPLASVFPVDVPAKDDTAATEPNIKERARPAGSGKPQTYNYTQRNTYRPSIKTASPRVFIPVFPGTNCEVDSKRAFEKAGAICTTQILRNLSQNDLDESIKAMAETIKASQIIMIPGGFSGGDEPDGSAKFITAVFRNPLITEAVTDLLENRDGLMLGICNGFQALVKLGLVPFGKITDMGDGSPTLTYNTIGRHMSRLVNTRIASVKSPWFAGVAVGDVHTIPVSHGEGRFIAPKLLLEQMAAYGQIAAQYVNFAGEPSMDILFNPNNSMEAIEGITSPDGRILGKMGHSERIGKNLYKNVPGDMDQKIFLSGVEYFK